MTEQRMTDTNKNPLEEKYTKWAIDDWEPAPMMAKYCSDLFDSKPKLTKSQIKELDDVLHDTVDNMDMDTGDNHKAARIMRSYEFDGYIDDLDAMNQLTYAYGREAQKHFAKMVDIINPDFEYDDRIVDLSGRSLMHNTPSEFSMGSLFSKTEYDLESMGLTDDDATMDWINPIEFRDAERFVERLRPVRTQSTELEVNNEQLDLNLDGLEDSKGLQQ